MAAVVLGPRLTRPRKRAPAETVPGSLNQKMLPAEICRAVVGGNSQDASFVLEQAGRLRGNH